MILDCSTHAASLLELFANELELIWLYRDAFDNRNRFAAATLCLTPDANDPITH